MSRLVIVPNDLRDKIHTAIDEALGGRPCSNEDREILYGQLLDYFDEHGCIPDFDLKEQTL